MLPIFRISFPDAVRADSVCEIEVKMSAQIGLDGIPFAGFVSYSLQQANRKQFLMQVL